MSNERHRPSWISEHLPEEILQSDLFRFRVKMINGTEVTVDMINDIEIEYERLEEQMDQLPGQYVWWASVYSEAKAMVTLMERRIKIRKGNLVEAALDQARAMQVKVTNDQVNAIVEKDQKIVEWEKVLIVLQKNTGKLYHMVKALELKTELMRSRSGFKRQERDVQR